MVGVLAAMNATGAGLDLAPFVYPVIHGQPLIQMDDPGTLDMSTLGYGPRASHWPVQAKYRIARSVRKGEQPWSDELVGQRGQPAAEWLEK